MTISNVDNATLNALVPNLDIGDVADPALRLAAFQYIYEEMQAIVLELNSIPAANLQNLSVTAAKLANLAVETGKIAELAVTTAKINDAAVTLAKMAANSVGSTQIVDLAVITAKLNDLVVTTAKIAELAVTGAKIADGTITESKYATGSVSTRSLLDGVVTRPKIAVGAVGSSQLDPTLLANFGDIAVQAEFDRRGVSVIKYGAKGDGSTDDTLAIQQAINANDIVFVPDGVYLISQTLKMAQGKKLFGLKSSVNGNIGVVFKSSGMTDGQYILQLAPTDNFSYASIHVEGITFRGTASFLVDLGECGIDIGYTKDHIIIRDCAFRDLKIGIGSRKWDDGVSVDTFIMKIQSCNIKECYKGLRFTTNRSTTITDTNIYDCAIWAEVTGGCLSGCTTQNTDESAADTGLWLGGQVSLINHYIEGSSKQLRLKTGSRCIANNVTFGFANGLGSANSSHIVFDTADVHLTVLGGSISSSVTNIFAGTYGAGSRVYFDPLVAYTRTLDMNFCNFEPQFPATVYFVDGDMYDKLMRLPYFLTASIDKGNTYKVRMGNTQFSTFQFFHARVVLRGARAQSGVYQYFVLELEIHGANVEIIREINIDNAAGITSTIVSNVVEVSGIKSSAGTAGNLFTTSVEVQVYQGLLSFRPEVLEIV